MYVPTSSPLALSGLSDAHAERRVRVLMSARANPSRILPWESGHAGGPIVKILSVLLTEPRGIKMASG